MRIAHVVCAFPPRKGGMGNVAYQFAKILNKRGVDITVFTPDYDLTGLVSEREIGPLRIFRLRPVFKIGNAAFLPQLFWRLKEFDAAHLHYPFYGAILPVLLRKIILGKKFKLVAHYHMDAVAPGIKGMVFNLYRFFSLPFVLRMADIITCASLDYVEHSQIAGFYKKRPQKFKEVLFGVDLNKFRIENSELRIVNKKNKNILFVGGLDKAHYFKGVDILLEAVSKLNELGVESWELGIVGDGYLRREYENLAKKLKIEDRVNFAAGVDNEKLVDYYNSCDCFVLPSINKGEAFGLVLLEAMASGKPVIASNLPGVRNVFEDGKQGLLVKPGDAEDLAEKIKMILENDELARKIGQAGRKLVEKKYTWEKAGEKLDKIYKNYYKGRGYGHRIMKTRLEISQKR